MTGRHIAREGGAVEPVAWDMPCGACGCGIYDQAAMDAFDGTIPKCKTMERPCVGAGDTAIATISALRAQLEAAEAANETVSQWAAEVVATYEAKEAELINLRAANIAYSQQVNELIGRAGNAEARAEAAGAEVAQLRELITPAFRVYKGDHVAQIDAGKIGLFTERYSGDVDLPRAMKALQDRALAARTKEAAP